MSIKKELFGKLSNGSEAYIYELTNANGMRLSISEFGAAIVKLITKDRYGNKLDVVCGYDELHSYEYGSGYQGAVVGRWANRIANGRFVMDGREYNLTLNKAPNHIHGGSEGKLSHVVWSGKIVDDGDEPSLRLFFVSPDGDNGYPGNLMVSVTYTLTNDNEVVIHYEATTDKKTVINLTNHAYFNLGGYDSGSIYDHVLTVLADTYLETDQTSTPTGKIMSVEGTPFDFRSPKHVGEDIDSSHPNIQSAGGYDHCFNFDGWQSYKREPSLGAKLYCEKSGIEMQVITNQPCVQIYSANWMNDADFPFKGGCPQVPRNAICLETQRMPDSMNHDGFTKCTLDVDEKYDYTTVYKFNIK